MIALALVGCLLVVLWVRRRRRVATLAGRNSARPVYSIEPPTRRLGSRRTEGL